MLYQLSYRGSSAGWAQISHLIVHLMNRLTINTYSMSQKKLPVPVPLRSVSLPVRSVHSSSAKFTAYVGEIIARLFSTTRSRDGSYHEKGYRLRPIALFIARVPAGPRGDGSARAYWYFFTLHYRMYYISGSYGQSFLASGELKTRLTLRARLIDWSISQYYKIYTRAHENRLNGRNETERAERAEKNHPFIIVKWNGTERECNGNGKFF